MGTNTIIRISEEELKEDGVLECILEEISEDENLSYAIIRDEETVAYRQTKDSIKYE